MVFAMSACLCRRPRTVSILTERRDNSVAARIDVDEDATVFDFLEEAKPRLGFGHDDAVCATRYGYDKALDYSASVGGTLKYASVVYVDLVGSWTLNDHGRPVMRNDSSGVASCVGGGERRQNGKRKANWRPMEDLDYAHHKASGIYYARERYADTAMKPPSENNASKEARYSEDFASRRRRFEESVPKPAQKREPRAESVAIDMDGKDREVERVEVRSRGRARSAVRPEPTSEVERRRRLRSEGRAKKPIAANDISHQRIDFIPPKEFTTEHVTTPATVATTVVTVNDKPPELHKQVGRTDGTPKDHDGDIFGVLMNQVRAKRGGAHNSSYSAEKETSSRLVDQLRELTDDSVDPAVRELQNKLDSSVPASTGLRYVVDANSLGDNPRTAAGIEQACTFKASVLLSDAAMAEAMVIVEEGDDHEAKRIAAKKFIDKYGGTTRKIYRGRFGIGKCHGLEDSIRLRDDECVFPAVPVTKEYHDYASLDAVVRQTAAVAGDQELMAVANLITLCLRGEIEAELE